jgi:hypothetical protein
MMGKVIVALVGRASEYAGGRSVIAKDEDLQIGAVGYIHFRGTI